LQAECYCSYLARDATAELRKKVVGLFELVFDSEHGCCGCEPEPGVDFLPLPACLSRGDPAPWRPRLWRSESWRAEQLARFEAGPRGGFGELKRGFLLRQVCRFLFEVSGLELDELLSRTCLVLDDLGKISDCREHLTEELAQKIFGDWRVRKKELEDDVQIATSKLFELLAAADPGALFEADIAEPRFYPLDDDAGGEEDRARPDPVPNPASAE
jgi:hypothetical protein